MTPATPSVPGEGEIPTAKEIREVLMRRTSKLRKLSDEALDIQLVWWRGELARRQRVAEAATDAVLEAMTRLGGLEFEESRRMPNPKTGSEAEG
jgi:hypothetical protein